MSNPLLKGIPGLDPDLAHGMPTVEQGQELAQMAGQLSPMMGGMPPQRPQMPPGGYPPEMPPPPTNNPMSANPVPPERHTQAQLSQWLNTFEKPAAAHDRAAAQLQQYMQDYSKMDQGTDYRPLAAFAGGLEHGNPLLLKAAEDMAPESPQKRAENLITQQQALTKLVGDNSQAKAMSQLMLGQQRNQFAQQRLDNQDRRFDQMTNKEARSTVNNDKILNTFVPRLEGAAKIQELIQAAKSGKVVSNNALLGQLNAEVSRLETGSQSPGLNAAEKTELLDKKAQMQAVIDSYTGNPQDAVSPGNLNAADKMVSELAGSYKKAISARHQVLRAGMAPQQQHIADAKYQAIKDSYTPRLGSFDEDGQPLNHENDPEFAAWLKQRGQ